MPSWICVSRMRWSLRSRMTSSHLRTKLSWPGEHYLSVCTMQPSELYRNNKQPQKEKGAPTRRVLKLNLKRLVRVVIRPDIHLDRFPMNVEPCRLRALALVNPGCVSSVSLPLSNRTIQNETHPWGAQKNKGVLWARGLGGSVLEQRHQKK